MYPFPVLDHDELLTLVYKTRAAAQDHDRDRLETRALQLFQALADHVAAERPDLLQVAPGDARLMARGQQRVIDDLIELAATAAGDADSCCCEQLADRLLADLTLEADDERRHLSHANHGVRRGHDH